MSWSSFTSEELEAFRTNGIKDLRAGEAEAADRIQKMTSRLEGFTLPSWILLLSVSVLVGGALLSASGRMPYVEILLPVVLIIATTTGIVSTFRLMSTENGRLLWERKREALRYYRLRLKNAGDRPSLEGALHQIVEIYLGEFEEKRWSYRLFGRRYRPVFGPNLYTLNFDNLQERHERAIHALKSQETRTRDRIRQEKEAGGDISKLEGDLAATRVIILVLEETEREDDLSRASTLQAVEKAVATLELEKRSWMHRLWARLRHGW